MSDSPYPRGEVPPPLKRNYNGWICLSLLFGIMILGALWPTKGKVDTQDDPGTYISSIKQALSVKASAKKLGQANAVLGDEKPDDMFRTARDAVAKTRFTDVNAALVYAAASYELGKPVTEGDLALLGKGTSNQRKIFTVFTAKSLTPARARALTDGLPSDSFFRKLLIADAFSKAGNQGPKTQLIDSVSGSSMAAVFLFGLVLMAGIFAWAVFIGLKLLGQIPPLGIPNPPANATEADGWAIKSFIFFAGYIVCEALTSLVGAFSPILQIGSSLLSGGVFFFLFNLRWGGGPIDFKKMGMGKGAPWAIYIFLGIFGFAMEFPVAMGMGLVGEKLFSHQTFTHPVAMQLEVSHNPVQVINLLLLASVLAPLYEEMIFRGTLMPALSKFVGIVPSILISSFLFASLHPQGFGAWLGLATVAVGSCVLAYHTRSIVPSFILHALHNGVTLLYVILVS